MLKSEGLVGSPQRVGSNVFNDDWFTPVRGCTTESRTGPNGFSVNRLDVALRKAGRGTMPHMNAVRREQQDGSEHAGALFFDNPQQSIQGLVKGCSPSDEF